RVDLPPSFLRLRSILVLWVGLVKLLETIQRIGLGRQLPRLGFSLPITHVVRTGFAGLDMLFRFFGGSLVVK
ncbi:hypothetical protein DT380_09330, partial [Pseudomonas aeruginosa]